MELKPETKLKDLLAEYPWLIDDAVKLDARFRALRSPLAKALIGRADVAEAGRRVGVDTETVITKIEELIRDHKP